MIDGIKLKIKDLDFARRITSNPAFEFNSNLNEQTGEIGNCKKSEYKNITIRVYDSGLVLISGSLHKFKNGGIHNYDDFFLPEIIEVIKQWRQLFDIDLTAAKVENIEFGVNIEPPIPTKELLKNIVSHKREPFCKVAHSNSDYKECVHQQFIIKVYDKAKQYRQQGQILRIELKYLKMAELNTIGIHTLSDLLNRNIYEFLGQMLVNTWGEVLYIDNTVNIENLTNKQQSDLKDWTNPLYWQKLTESPIKKKFNTERERYEKIIQVHSENVQAKINQCISKTWEKLTNYSNPCKIENREKLTSSSKTQKPKSGKINHLYNGINIPSEKKRCILTGLDISMQKDGSIFICSTGIKWYLENAPETYNNVLYPRLAKSIYKNATLKKQIEEIHHSVRNEFNDLFHNHNRDEKKRGARLFDDSPYYSNKLKSVIEFRNRRQ